MYICTNQLVAQIAEKCARGDYQRRCATGDARASGSDLPGKWKSKYFHSRNAWLKRVEDAGVYIEEKRIGRKLFVILAADAVDATKFSMTELLNMWR